MRKVEYRIEEIPLSEHGGPQTVALVERLNELGKEGWEVASIDLTLHPSYSPGPVPVLLEREIVA